MIITNVIFEAPSRLHFDHEDMIVVLLKFPSGSVLVIEGLFHIPEVSERLSREQIEPIVGSGALKTR